MGESTRDDELERIDGLLVYPAEYVDSTHAPLYITQVKARSDDPNALAKAVSFWKAIDYPVFVVNDLRTLESSTPAGRSAYAQLAAAIHPYTQQHLIGVASVVANAEQRGVVTAALWMTKNPVPQDTFSEIATAVVYGKKQLEKYRRE